MKIASLIPLSGPKQSLNRPTNLLKDVGFRQILDGQKKSGVEDQQIHSSEVEQLGIDFTTLLKKVEDLLKKLDEYKFENFQHHFNNELNNEGFAINDIFHSKILLEEWFQFTIHEINKNIKLTDMPTSINEGIEFALNLKEGINHSNNLSRAHVLKNLGSIQELTNQLMFQSINQQRDIISDFGQLTKSFKETSQLIQQMLNQLGQLEKMLNGREVDSDYNFKLQQTINRFFEENRILTLINVLKISHLETKELNQTLAMNLHKVHFSLHENDYKTDMLNMSEELGIKNQSTLPIMDTNVKQEYRLQLSTFNGDITTNHTTQKEFVERFYDILKSSKFFRTMDGKASLTIKLHPEHLGTITVKLIQKNNETVAKIIASTQSAKELLEYSSHLLRQALPNTEIIIDRFDVMHEQQMESFQHEKDRESTEKEHNRKSTKKDEESESFSDKLEQELNFMV